MMESRSLDLTGENVGKSESMTWIACYRINDGPVVMVKNTRQPGDGRQAAENVARMEAKAVAQQLADLGAVGLTVEPWVMARTVTTTVQDGEPEAVQ